MNAKEILSLENSCIQEEPVYCSAECPVHIDVRSMLELVQKGSFEEAEKIYRRKVFFPGIISRICTEPCRNACLRKKVDESIAIRLLEKACVDYSGKNRSIQAHSVVRKKKHIAVVGGGMSGSSCALELVHKGYDATIFEKSGKLGGRLWDIDPAVLPPQVIADEMSQMEQEGIIIKLNSYVGDIADMGFDAVYVATGKDGDTFGIAVENGKIQYDGISLETSGEGVFIGGSLVSDKAPYSPVEAVAHGIRAARSIERYFQKASLTVGRENEGVLNTRLYTEIRNEPQKPRVLPKEQCNQYTETEAMEEAGRCLLCECRECVKACDFLDYFNQYPKRYIRDISKTLTALQGIRSKMIATRIINSCSLCGLCGEICPNSLDMGEVCLESRRIQFETDTMPHAFYEFWIRDMLFSNDERVRLYKNQAGYGSSKYLFFPGCQLGASSPKYVEKTYKYLMDSLDGGAGLALGCCGAPAEWSGRKELHEEQLRLFQSNWESMGRPQVILACPTCHKMFGKYLPEVPIKSLWSILEENEPPCRERIGEGSTVAIYDPCSSRYNPDIQEDARKLVKKLGYGIEELPFNRKYAQCCSFGGLISTINQDLANKITEHRISASPNHYVTYCTNCRDDFAGKGKPTWYLLDLVFGDAGEEQARRLPPSYTVRRENRVLLKNRVLEELWGERMQIEKPEYESIKVRLSDELERKLEKEFILLEEIKQVIHYAETTGYKVLDKKSGRFIAHLQIGIITYWAEYLPADGEYIIINAYSHRMQIEEKVNKI